MSADPDPSTPARPSAACQTNAFEGGLTIEELITQTQAGTLSWAPVAALDTAGYTAGGADGTGDLSVTITRIEKRAWTLAIIRGPGVERYDQERGRWFKTPPLGRLWAALSK